MTSDRSLFPRAWRLAPDRDTAEDVIAVVRVRGPASEQTVLVPYSAKLEYVVVATRGAALAFDDLGDNFRISKLGLLASLWARLRLALIFKKKKYLKYNEFSLFSGGRKRERKRFTTFNQHMFNTGVALDGELITRHPELLTGWPAIAGPATRAPGAVKAAIVVHIYYEDTWLDFAQVMKRLTIPFDLIVTTVSGREGLSETVKRDFPWAEVEVMENRGRDVRPFLALLEQGRFDRYAYVCKLHGKKSSDGGRMLYLGALWRRRLLFDLLAGPNIAETIAGAFEHDPGIGMIGPRAFRLPSKTYPDSLSWGSDNRETILELAEQMGVSPDRFRLDFFGGTMFWARPEALRPLRALRLAATFPEEKGLLDGALEHSVERLFATSTVAAGYRLADSDGLTVLDAPPSAGARVDG
jgi:hypothetical protein